jgi:uncharacterized membrane-anchored protein YjiN (DUF445 family)
MRTDEELLVDEDGIPILKDVVGPEAASADNGRISAPLSSVPVEMITRELLGNQTLRKALDEYAAELSLNIYQHIDRSIRPVIAEAVTRAIDEAGNSAYDEIRQQLESMIPEILARVLEEMNPSRDG